MSLREKMNATEILKSMKNGMQAITNSFMPDKPEEKIFTFRDKITKDSYMELKNANRAHALAAKSIREEAIRNKGEVRHILRSLKSKEGQVARLHHVSLCFLKGKKYSEVEPNVAKGNRIPMEAIKGFLLWWVNFNYHKDLAADITKFLGE
jgi:hypothetical protein